MLTTLIRLMGAWLAVYGLLFGMPFMYMLKHDPTGLDTILTFLPSIVSFLIGMSYIIFAPKISGARNSHCEKITDILPSGLILLGVYWLGTGFFYAVSNVNFYLQIFDTNRYDIYSDSSFWIAISCFAQAIGGLALIIVGNRIRAQKYAEKYMH